jgi:hypothetical protein
MQATYFCTDCCCRPLCGHCTTQHVSHRMIQVSSRQLTPGSSLHTPYWQLQRCSRSLAEYVGLWSAQSVFVRSVFFACAVSCTMYYSLHNKLS